MQENINVYCIYKRLLIIGGFPGGATGKELPANAGDVRDVGSILASGRSPGEEQSNPL